MARNNGGPAFPRTGNPGGYDVGQKGMSLRDYFAAKALPTIYAEFWRSNDSCPPDWETGIACDAYRMADAMLRARDKGETP